MGGGAGRWGRTLRIGSILMESIIGWLGFDTVGSVDAIDPVDGSAFTIRLGLDLAHQLWI